MVDLMVLGLRKGVASSLAGTSKNEIERTKCQRLAEETSRQLEIIMKDHNDL
jgi:hypothetical protein